MRAWRPWALAAWLAAGAGLAAAQSPADAVVLQLREQGYVEFTVSRTLLGRIRVVALAPDGERREIVFNPATGEILRDYSEAADGGVVPRILDRSEGEAESRVAGNDDDAPHPDDDKAGPQAASSPSEGGGEEDAPRPNGDEDGNHGHGNDEDGSDDDNPGRGHGNDGNPGGGRSNGNNGNGNAASGGNGNKN